MKRPNVFMFLIPKNIFKVKSILITLSCCKATKAQAHTNINAANVTKGMYNNWYGSSSGPKTGPLKIFGVSLLEGRNLPAKSGPKNRPSA